MAMDAAVFKTALVTALNNSQYFQVGGDGNPWMDEFLEILCTEIVNHITEYANTHGSNLTTNEGEFQLAIE